MRKTSTRPATAEAPERRNRRSPDEVSNRIVQAAAEAFKRGGYAGATTAAIARQAEVTEAQLFRGFGSKANLFREAVFKPLDEQLRNFTDEHFPDDGDYSRFKENAELYIESLRKFLADNVDMITSLIVLETYEQAATPGVGAIASLAKYFERGAGNMSAWSADPRVDPALMVRISFAAVLACVMFKDWIFPPGLAPDAEIDAAINAFVLDGLNAKAGRDGAP